MTYSKFLVLSVFILLVTSCQSDFDRLKRSVEKELTTEPGFYAVAFKDLSSGQELLIHERESFHAASTMKTPVMIEVFKQAAEGNFSLSDSIIVKNEFKSIVDGSIFSLDSLDDSEFGLYKKIGNKQLLSSLVYDMIIVSSNLATNIIIDLVDAKNVTQTMRDLGAKDIQVLRGVEDDKAFQKGMSNTTTAYDLMLIYEKMALGRTVDSAASMAMIDILFDQRFNMIIPANLPADVRIAHKTGSIKGVHHDAGIVFLPDGRKYVIVLLGKELEDDEKATRMMANVSKLIYDFVMTQH
jgi:beta-lactamase class A